MTDGDSVAKGFVTWQTVAVALASLLSTGFMLLEKNTIDHLGTLDQAMNSQATALNRMAVAMDGLTQSNVRFDLALDKIYNRMHSVEEAQSTSLASIVTNEHDISQLRNEMNRHTTQDIKGFKSLGVERSTQ
jgi:hypothetical protein